MFDVLPTPTIDKFVDFRSPRKSYYLSVLLCHLFKTFKMPMRTNNCIIVVIPLLFTTVFEEFSNYANALSEKFHLL